MGAVFYKNQMTQKRYEEAVSFYDRADYRNAADLFEELGEYNNSKEMLEKCKIASAEADYAAFLDSLETCSDFSMAEQIIIKHLSGEGINEESYEEDPYYCYVKARQNEETGGVSTAWYYYKNGCKELFDSSSRAQKLAPLLDQKLEAVENQLQDETTTFDMVDVFSVYYYDKAQYYVSLQKILLIISMSDSDKNDFEYVCAPNGESAYAYHDWSGNMVMVTYTYPPLKETETFSLTNAFYQELNTDIFHSEDALSNALSAFAQEHGGAIVKLTKQDLAQIKSRAPKS